VLLSLDAPANPDQLDEYRAARAALETAVWELCVHREAIGMFDNTAVLRRYPIPPPR
jgi:hypothetical protein